MRNARIKALALAAVCAALLCAPAIAGTASQLDKLKSLAGDWEATTADGKGITKVSFKETAGGSGIVETQTHGAEGGEMLTVYSVDGDDVMLTHFCLAGNAPRMKAAKASADGRMLDFVFMDATNLAKPADGHMSHLKIVFLDSDHFVEEWTWTENGKSDPKKIQFSRKK